MRVTAPHLVLFPLKRALSGLSNWSCCARLPIRQGNTGGLPQSVSPLKLQRNGLFWPVYGGPKRFKPAPVHTVCVRDRCASNARCKFVASAITTLRDDSAIGARRKGRSIGSRLGLATAAAR